MRLSRPVLALRALLVGTIVVHGPGCFLDAQGLPMEGGQPSGGDGPGGGGAGDGGAPPVCLTPADCGSPSVCSAFECNGGSCDTEAEPLNTNCGDQGTEVCDGNGMCLTVDGEDCAAASECLSGFCADGVCCDVVCAGPCNSCALPTAGACTPYTVDTDPDDECPGVAPGTGVCDGASGCADGTVAASGSFSDDAVAQAVATYANGDAVIVGDFQGPLSLGTGALPGSPSRDAFVVRLAADGSHVWSRGFGEGGDQTAFGAAVDSTGAVIVGGPFAGGINLDDGFGPRDSLGANDGFLVKLDAVGATVWGNAFGDGLEQVVIGVGVDEQDAVYIAGYFSGTVNFGPTVTTTLTSAGLLDVFIAKFTSAGDHEWSKRFGDAANQFSTGFAVNADGECAITGAFDGVMQFGTGDLISAGYDVFVAQLDSDGEPVFSSSFGDVSAQRSHAVAIDPLGQVAVVGDYVGTMDFGDGALPSTPNPDVFIGVLSDTGVHVWSAAFGGTGTEIAWGVAFDASGNIALMGELDAATDFGGGALTPTGSFDLFAAKFSANGTELWSYLYGDDQPQLGNAVAAGPDNDLWLVGFFAGTLTFGSTPLTNGSAADAFFARLDP